MAGQKQHFKFLSTSALTIGLAALGAQAAVAMDDFTTPTGEQVVGGHATFDRPDAGVLNVNQHTDRAVINWDSFNIGKKGKTEFFQPGSGSLAVNRVTGQNADPTRILGSLKANGRIMVLDRNGVFFGHDAVIDVGGIVASTGDVDTASVMRGDTKIDLTNFGDGSIVNEGLVRVADAGLAAFVAPHAANNGVIEARLGKVVLASGGERATVDLYGDGLVEIAVDGQKGKALVENNGTIDAEGGTVLMTASAATEIVDDVINMNGVVNVSSVTVQGGRIVLSGGKAGKVNVKGTLNASGENGGRIDVRGKDIDVGADALLTVDGGQNGDGGEIIIFGDNYAVLNGRAFARGGVLGGNGGFIELSARETVGFDGFVSTFAGLGEIGTFLIDPRFIIIHSGAVNSPTNDPIPATGNNKYVISAAALAKAMAGTNVVLQANSFIDVGTSSDGYANLSLQQGETIPNNLGDGIIDLSTSKVAGGSTLPPPSNGCNGAGNPHCADIGFATTGNLTLQSSKINFNRDLIMGLGNLKIEGTPGDFAPIINIKSVIFGLEGYTKTTPDLKIVNLSKKVVLGDDRIDSNAINVTVLNNNALIQQAVWLSTAGSMILVQPGTYDESVSYNTVDFGGFEEVKGQVTGYEPIYADRVETYTGHGITLDRANLTIRADGNFTKNPNTTARGAESIIDPNSPGFHVTANNVSINGFTINTGDDGVLVDSGADNITISNNIFTNQTSSAVRVLTGSDKVNVANNAMTLNGGVTGVSINGGSSHDVTGNVINGGVYGIYLNNTGSNNNVLNNTIGQTTGTSSNAITVVGNTGVTNLNSNHIYNTGWDGIAIHSGTGFVTVQGNDIHNTTGASGIVAINHNGDALIDNNIVDGADRLGIYVWNSNGLDISGNTVSDTGREAGWWTSGIHLEGANDTTVQGNTISNTGGDAIHVGGNGNTWAAGTTGNKILNNIIGTAGAGDIHGDGIYSNDSDGIVITGNTITDTARTSEYNKGSGIQVVNTTGATIGATGKGNANVITNAGWDGIRVADSSGVMVQKNVITADAADNDSRVGIYFGNVTGSAIKGNTVNNANRYAAIYTEGGADLSVTNNDIVNSDEAGILMQNAGGQNYITGNTVDQTGQNVKPSDGSGSGDGIKVVGSYGSADSDDADLLPDTGVLIGNNSVGMNGGDIRGNGIYVLGSTHTLVRNNDVNDTDGDGVKLENTDFANVRANTISNVTRVGIYGGSTTNTIIHNNILINGNTTLSGYGAISTDFGSNLTVTGNDIDGSAGHGIRINGAGGTNLIRNNDVDGVAYDGIRTENVSNLTIASNEIGQTDGANNDGIYVTGGSNLLIGGAGNANIVKNSGDDGIAVDGVTGTVEISHNQVDGTGAGVNHNGIEVSGTSGALIQRNVVRNAGWDGINVQSSTGTQILNNKISDTLGASGIGLVNGVSDTDIRDNVIENSKQYGMYIGGHTGTLNVTDNTVTGVAVYDGIFVTDSTSPNIRRNVINGVAGDAISVANSASATVINNKIGLVSGMIGGDGISVVNSGSSKINDNEIKNITGSGIFVDPSHDTVVYSNTITGGLNGIYVLDSNRVKIGAEGKANGITGSGTGILLVNSDDAVVSYNEIEHTLSDGIHARRSNDLLITENNVYGAGGDGIFVRNGNHAHIFDNHISSASANGISTRGIDDVSIAGNDVLLSGANGIKVAGSDEAYVYDNTVLLSMRDGVFVRNTDYSSIEDNVVVLSLGNGIHVDGGNETAIHGNLVALSAIDGITVENTGGDQCGWSDVYGLSEGGSPNWNVRITGNDVVLSGRHGISAFDTGSVRIRNNEVALSGTNFMGWIEDILGGGLGLETASLVAEGGPESIFDYGFILGWGNGDGIHVEGAYRPSGYEGGYGDIRLASIEGGDYAPSRPAVSIVGNDVRWSGGDGIEVRDSGSVRIARNYVEASGINATAFTLGGLIAHFSSLDFGSVIEGFNAAFSGEASMNGFLSTVLPAPEFTFWGNSDGIHVENVQGDENFSGYGFEGFDALGKRDFAVRIRNNEVIGTGGDGIEVRDSGWTLVEGNTVATTGLLNDFYSPYLPDLMMDLKVKGHFVDDHQDWLYSGNGISVNNGQFDGPSFLSLEKGYYGLESVAVIRNNTVTDAEQNGIMTETVDHLLVDSNVVLNSGAANLFVAGAYNGDVVLTGNTFTFDNEAGDGVEQIGALFESGIIDLTGASNTFNGGTKGIVFRPASTYGFPFPFPFPFLSEGEFEGPGASFAHMELVDNTIGTTVFNGQKTYYVELANGAFFNPGTPTVLNGLNATYDGFRPANVGGILTQAQYDAIESKIFHYNDLASLGLFFFGLVPDNNENIGQEDIFNRFNSFTGSVGPIRITLMGLPNLSGGGTGGGLANFLANIAPAAGEGEQEDNAYETVFELSDIEPAAGGNGGNAEDAACWSEAAAQASAGAAVSYSFGSSAEEALSQTAGCGTSF